MDTSDLGCNVRVLKYFVSYILDFIEHFNSLTLPDLTPNTGLWWYFFTEMFDHFRPFFLMVFNVWQNFPFNFKGLIYFIIDAFINLRGASLYKIPVSIAHFTPDYFRLKTALVRYDPLYASLVLLGILGTFKAYSTLSDPGLFLSMIAIFPETYPCTH